MYNIRNIRKLFRPLKKNSKKILIFDTETTGLPKRKCRDFKNPENEYFHFSKSSKYKSSRVVQLAWYLLDFNENQDIKNVKTFLINCDFDIPYQSTKIHGITKEMCSKDGIPISDALNLFFNDLKNCDYILAHNILFDYHVIMNEINLCKNHDLLNLMLKLKENNRLICSGNATKSILKLKMTYGNSYKMPRLSELYKYCFDCEFDNQHNAKYDVFALVEILNGRKLI